MCMNIISFIEKDRYMCCTTCTRQRFLTALGKFNSVTLEDEKPGRGPLMETGERLELQRKAGFRKVPGEPGLPSLLPQGTRDTQCCF